MDDLSTPRPERRNRQNPYGRTLNGQGRKTPGGKITIFPDTSRLPTKREYVGSDEKASTSSLWPPSYIFQLHFREKHACSNPRESYRLEPAIQSQFALRPPRTLKPAPPPSTPTPIPPPRASRCEEFLKEALELGHDVEAPGLARCAMTWTRLD